MKTEIFSVYDAKVNAWQEPKFARNNGDILRAFIEAAQNPQTTFGKWPADFTLFKIGEFDDLSGTITSYEVKIPLGTALELLGTNHRKDNTELASQAMMNGNKKMLKGVSNASAT